MKNHDIHENKNPCPEFNGEKMHEHPAIITTILPESPAYLKGFRVFLF
jgi:hypothetical protein